MKQLILLIMSFQRMGVLHVGQRIDEQADFEKIYKNGVFIFLEMTLIHINSPVIDRK